METVPDTTTLWKEFHRPLGAFLARRVRRAADVDDVLQEVFVRIHKRIDTLEQEERITAWIFQIARNALVDYERVRATRSDAPAPDGPEVEPVAPESEERPLDLSGCLRPMIGALPEPYQEAIRLTELDGLTQAEAADRAGVSLSGMKSRIQRGRERLKKMLLACCHVELDARGGVMDYQSRCHCAAENNTE